MHLENDLQLGIVGAKDLEEEREEADVTVGVHVPQLRVRQRHPNFILNTIAIYGPVAGSFVDVPNSY
jgi:hypothetical protein